ncbi:hypothetical protein SAMN05518684_102104 [Salipaludibacillus aurantiacus]|uniref:Uncharacterized protein n=1 Tax=Salipaludibacillus aurantiacus TaxID=1601833 RepID=A0A1H9Q9Y6_9BACI|nr:hypothetical protein SAMN05518684_102104 [Salipaludibacillus aurantiacus]
MIQNRQEEVSTQMSLSKTDRRTSELPGNPRSSESEVSPRKKSVREIVNLLRSQGIHADFCVRRKEDKESL